MEVNVMKPASVGPDYGVSGLAGDKVRGAEQVEVKADTKQAETEKPKVALSDEQVEQMTEALNKFMEGLDADLQFSIHEKTNSLMVRLVDTKKQKVLKEFPPHEFLDMMAKISEYVGSILDKKA